MTFMQGHDGDLRGRPLWMPHPGLLAFIALLWMVAGAVDAVSLLK